MRQKRAGARRLSGGIVIHSSAVSGSFRGALLLVAVVFAFEAMLTLWLPFDGRVFRLVQEWRSCGVASAVQLIDVVVPVVLAVICALTVVPVARIRPWLLLGVVVAVVAGAAGGELLKTILERGRMAPSSQLRGTAFRAGM